MGESKVCYGWNPRFLGRDFFNLLLARHFCWTSPVSHSLVNRKVKRRILCCPWFFIDDRAREIFFLLFLLFVVALRQHSLFFKQASLGVCGHSSTYCNHRSAQWFAQLVNRVVTLSFIISVVTCFKWVRRLRLCLQQLSHVGRFFLFLSWDKINLLFSNHLLAVSLDPLILALSLAHPSLLELSRRLVHLRLVLHSFTLGYVVFILRIR